MEALELLNPQALKAGVSFVCSSFLNGFVLGDPNQIKQVWINLLLNAVEAMPNGGTVTIASRLSDGVVAVRIRDEGTGMDEARMAAIGEPFYTTKEHGTGLGLIVCRRILDLHRGTMTITSELHAGTTVEVRLPLAYQLDPPDPAI
jgi:two-component system sporulation sensor kinase A